MEERMIFAGAGGQGLMTLGKLVALSAMREGLQVTWFPSYGAEVRGGTAHCHVVVKDSEIFSPLVEAATALGIMNKPSFEKFSPRLADGGLLALNTSLVEPPESWNGELLAVDATGVANELGEIRSANMVMLGALNARKALFSDETLEGALEEFLGKRRSGLLEVNLAAYRRGREFA